MRVNLVHGGPLALLGALVGWTAIDLTSQGSSLWQAAGGTLLAMAFVAAVHGSRVLQPSLHRASRAIVAVVFIGERLFLLGVDPLPMIGFIVLLMTLVSLQSIERTFVPVFKSITDPTLTVKVDSAAIVAYIRTLGLLGFVFLGSFLLALLIPIIGFQSRELVAAFGFALALLLIITWLAVMPVLPAKLQTWANRQRREQG